MKGNRELDELLISYILKELSPEEEALAIAYINADEKNKRQFEELQNTFSLIDIQHGLDKVNIDNEWKQFEQSIAGENQKFAIIKSPLADENGETGERVVKMSRVKKIFIAVAVAASIFTIVLLFRNLASTNYRVAEKEVVKTEGSGSAIGSLLKKEINNSGKEKKIVLQDGSEVILADKSEIRYYEPFVWNRRDIILKGKAEFKVAKDKTKPFVVHSLFLSTTALGTEFTVTAFENDENITVRLTEGKVVVKSKTNDQVKIAQEYYLLPGQELVYSNRKYAGRVSKFGFSGSDIVKNNKKDINKDSPEIPDNSNGSWYMFNNQSLDQVFEQLELLYNVEILFSKRDVYNMYFIGKFDKTDSVSIILNQIASLNKLKVTKTNNTFIITRKRK